MASTSVRKTCTRPISPRSRRAGVRLGLSTHGFYEILKALHFRPSYIALGAVFPTTTKVMPTAPQGLKRLARYVRLLDGVVPLVAIGGIDLQVLPDVLATGVGCAAVVRAVTEARGSRGRRFCAATSVYAIIVTIWSRDRAPSRQLLHDGPIIRPSV